MIEGDGERESSVQDGMIGPEGAARRNSCPWLQTMVKDCALNWNSVALGGLMGMNNRLISQSRDFFMWSHLSSVIAYNLDTKSWEMFFVQGPDWYIGQRLKLLRHRQIFAKVIFISRISASRISPGTKG